METLDRLRAAVNGVTRLVDGRRSIAACLLNLAIILCDKGIQLQLCAHYNMLIEVVPTRSSCRTSIVPFRPKLSQCSTCPLAVGPATPLLAIFPTYARLPESRPNALLRRLVGVVCVEVFRTLKEEGYSPHGDHSVIATFSTGTQRLTRQASTPTIREV